MNKKINGFTLVEIVITLAITSFLFVTLALIIPNLSDHFLEQKKRLVFQQTFTLDNFYINNKITNSEKVLENYSSGSLGRNNSFLTLLNNSDDLNYSIIYLGNGTGKILEADDLKGKVTVKNTYFYSDYVKVGANDIYYTNPGNHSIHKFNISSGNTSLEFGNLGVSGYSNAGFGIFNTPTGITYNSNNNTLYISDSGNNTIRNIDLTTQIVGTIAGSNLDYGYNSNETNTIGTNLSESIIDYPTGIEYSNDENSIYFSDTYNNRIRKINLSDNKIYTLLGSDELGFNKDNGISSEILLNYPLAITKTSSGIIFGDTKNGKIRYYNEIDNSLITLIGIEKLDEIKNNNFTKYTKNYYNSYLQLYGSGFYFNDLKNGIIYDYNFGIDNIIGNDDSINNILGSLDKNILINGDIENDISNLTINNDLINSDSEIFYLSGDRYMYPISGNGYLVANTKGKTASGYITFDSNLSDGDKIQIKDKIFEFDDGLLEYELGNIVVPIGISKKESIDNFIDGLYNYDINYSGTGDIIKISSDNIGLSGNSESFSGSTINFTLQPSTGTLTGGIEYISGTKEFKFDKNLITNNKYKLSFYISSDNIINTDISEPLLTINTGTGNIEEKILHVNKNWVKKEIIFNGIGNNQIINFKIKYGEEIYIDLIELKPIGDSQLLDYNDRSKFQIGLLNNFYVINQEKILLNNTLDKELMLIYSGGLDTVDDDLSMVDYNSFNLNLKNDYIGESLIEYFQYINNKKNIIYDIGIRNYKLKISNNIK